MGTTRRTAVSGRGVPGDVGAWRIGAPPARNWAAITSLTLAFCPPVLTFMLLVNRVSGWAAVSWCALSLLCSFVAIVLGAIGMRAPTGRQEGLAVIGLILGGADVLLSAYVFVLLGAIASFPCFGCP